MGGDASYRSRLKANIDNLPPTGASGLVSVPRSMASDRQVFDVRHMAPSSWRDVTPFPWRVTTRRRIGRPGRPDLGDGTNPTAHSAVVHGLTPQQPGHFTLCWLVWH